MKVLVVTQYFYPENFRINDLIKGLCEEGHEVTVLTGKPNYPKGELYQNYKLLGKVKEIYYGATVIRTPIIPRKQSATWLALNYISFPIFCILYNLKFLLFNKFDRVLVCQLSPIFMAFPAMFYRFIHKTPSVIWITDLWPESLRATGTIRNSNIINTVGKIVNYIYSNFDLILMSCKGFEDDVKHRAPQTQKSFFPYWAEDLYKPLHIKDEVSPDYKELMDKNKRILTFAGNIGEAQSLTTLIYAIDKLSAEEQNSLKVLIAGEGRAKEEVTKLVNKLEIKCVKFLGGKPVIDMPHLFAISDALYISLKTSPIFTITIPSKTQSYMACAKPIIASIDGETSTIIQDAKCGFVSESENIDALTLNLKKLISLSTNKLDEMGEASYYYYKKNFNRHISLKKICRHLQETSYTG